MSGAPKDHTEWKVTLHHARVGPRSRRCCLGWDAHLVDAMAQHRAAIFEEQVVGDLVADLRRTR
ncbi:MAG: DUF2399 domain-containing protein [Microthrixaceae bacterium]|nr:DUF2399 domain-containing protein [Microthrixaceae bacterium]